MVSLVGLGEVREDGTAVAGLSPVELATVDDDTAKGGAVTSQELGGGGNHDVSTVLERAQQGRGRNRVVDNQRNVVAVCNLGDGRDIEDVDLRVGDGLTVETDGVVLNCCLPGLRVIRVLDESAVDAKARQGDLEQGLSTAVEAWRNDEVVACTSQGEDSSGLSCLAGGEQYGSDAALEAGDALLDGIHSRVGQAGVNRACIREVEAVGSVLSGIEDVGGGVVNRQVTRGGLCVRSEAGVNSASGQAPVGGVAVVVLGGHFRYFLAVFEIVQNVAYKQ